jgi:hypothetical protein
MKKPLVEIKSIPVSGQGSFWEDRGDRRHCGIDIYAKKGDEIYAITKGKVVAIEVMTHPDFNHYWNITYQIVIETEDLYIKYGEVAEPQIEVGDLVKEGQVVAHVGQVLDGDKIGENDPVYVQKLKYGKNSMLHLECWKNDPITSHEKYLGGNWFEEEKPENLMNPEFLLKD